MAATKSNNSKRLLSLDILRGITIAGMIMVNNPGSWGSIYEPLEHAEWNGLTPTDLVFPFFMFIMGVSMYFSLRKYDFRLDGASAWKVVRRTIVIFAIGLGIAWLAKVLRAIPGEGSVWEAATDFGHLRLLGVMPRLALCYGVSAMIALLCSRRAIAWIVGLILGIYTILLIVGDGWAFSTHNIIARIDHAVLGPDHMYADTVGGLRLKFDPEGLLSTLPSIAHTLIGFLCGGMIARIPDNYRRADQLFVVGTVLALSGWLLSYGFPINKKIWSPTFVLTTCGMASLLLGLLINVIDIKGHRHWCRFFEAFGVNPLFMYVLGSVGGVVLSMALFGGRSLHGLYYQEVVKQIFTADKLASLIFALSYVCLIWVVGYILYKKKIYIKI